MKRILNLLLALLVIALPLSAGDVFIDGNEYSDVDVIQLNGLTTEPSTAPLGNARMYYNSTDDKVYLSKNGNSYSELGSGGSSTFLGLTDTPSSYSGQAGKYLKVNATEDGLEFDTPTGAGDITAIGDVTNGDAFTGSQGNTLYFEGTTSDDYEIALTGADATADRTITLPNATGTLLLKDQIDTEAEFESLLFDILTPTEALLLDQTSPQTISNGIPLLDTTPTGSANIKSLVNKEYVDLAVTSLGAVYYMYDDDDATGYKTCHLDPSSSAETYIEKTSLSDDDYIGGWISATGEAPAKLLKGVYNWYLTLEKPSGTKTLRVYWKLIERKSDDSEIVIATSSNSNEIDTKANYLVPLQLDDDYIPDSGSRIVGKLYADVSDGGSVPTIKVYYQGNTSSRWEIPANSEIFKSIFVPYDGAVKDVDLGSYDLTTTGDITAGNLNISNWDTAYSWGDHSIQNYLDLDTYPNADTDSTDDLTTSTTFGGDVSGTYNSISVNKIKGATVDDTNKATGKTLRVDGSGNLAYYDDDDGVIVFIVDGGGSAITTGDKIWFPVPVACTVKRVELTADTTGSATVDIQTASYTNYPTFSSMVGAGTKPAISSAQKSQDTDLSDWSTTSITKDAYVKLVVDSASTITKLVAAFFVDKN